MSARQRGLVALLALACLLGGAGCGGGGRKADAAVSLRAVARWRGGLLAWNREMLHALDQISLLLSTQDAVATIDEPSSPLRAELAPFALTLAGCAATVRRLGPEPSSLPAARGFALTACAELEHGARLIESALHGPSGRVEGVLARAGAPLSNGQNELTVATRTLAAAAAPAAHSG